jgi:hypothetical protein
VSEGHGETEEEESARGQTLVVEAVEGERVVVPQLGKLVVAATVVAEPVHVEHHSPGPQRNNKA